MKKIKSFFETAPGYTRASVKAIAKYSKCAESTVRKFKKTDEFKVIKTAHLQKISTETTTPQA